MTGFRQYSLKVSIKEYFSENRIAVRAKLVGRVWLTAPKISVYTNKYTARDTIVKIRPMQSQSISFTNIQNAHFFAFRSFFAHHILYLKLLP